MKKIHNPEDLAAFASEHGLRSDWHEPDEQDVDAIVKGNDFDNAGFWPERRAGGILERHIILKVEGKPVAAVNLATVLAWATQHGRMVAQVNEIRDNPEKAREMAQEAAERAGVNVDDLAFMVTPTGERVELPA